jgi:hypothetical protein
MGACSTDPAASIIIPPRHSTAELSASYHLQTGEMATGWSGNGGSVTTSDVFYVDQLPQSGSMTLTLGIHVRCSGYGSGAGFSLATLPGESVSDSYSFPPIGPPNYLPTYIDRTYSLGVAVAQGDSFVVNASLRSGTESFSGRGSANSQIYFPDLPPGVQLHSCHGFTIDTATPARRSTWGGLKTRYR